MRWIIVLAMLLCATSLSANPLLCRTIDDARKFANKSGLELTWQGIVQGDVMVLELWQAQSGLWLLAAVTPMGVSCLQMHGKGGQMTTPQRDALKPMVPTP